MFFFIHDTSRPPSNTPVTTMTVSSATRMHGEVGVETAIGREPWRVGRTADRADLVDAQEVGELDGTGARDLEDLERRQIDQADVLTHVEVLADGDRAPPAVVPLDLAFGEP